MITKNISDVLFTVEKLPTYARYEQKLRTKTEVTEYFAGYAIVNIDSGKVLGQISEDYRVSSNKDRMDSVSALTPIKEWVRAYYNNDKTFFIIDGLTPYGISIEGWGNVFLGISIHNPYTSHRSSVIYYSLYDENKEVWLPTNTKFPSNTLRILDAIKNSDIIPPKANSYLIPSMPEKYVNILSAKLKELEQYSALKPGYKNMIIIGEVMKKWEETNFESANQFGRFANSYILSYL